MRCIQNVNPSESQRELKESCHCGECGRSVDIGCTHCVRAYIDVPGHSIHGPSRFRFIKWDCRACGGRVRLSADRGGNFALCLARWPEAESERKPECIGCHASCGRSLKFIMESGKPCGSHPDDTVGSRACAQGPQGQDAAHRDSSSSGSQGRQLQRGPGGGGSVLHGGDCGAQTGRDSSSGAQSGYPQCRGLARRATPKAGATQARTTVQRDFSADSIWRIHSDSNSDSEQPQRKQRCVENVTSRGLDRVVTECGKQQRERERDGDGDGDRQLIERDRVRGIVQFHERVRRDRERSGAFGAWGHGQTGDSAPVDDEQHGAGAAQHTDSQDGRTVDGSPADACASLRGADQGGERAGGSGVGASSQPAEPVVEPHPHRGGDAGASSLGASAQTELADSGNQGGADGGERVTGALNGGKRRKALSYNRVYDHVLKTIMRDEYNHMSPRVIAQAADHRARVIVAAYKCQCVGCFSKDPMVEPWHWYISSRFVTYKSCPAYKAFERYCEVMKHVMSIK